MKGLNLRKIVGLFALVLSMASVLIAHVWKQNTYVRLSIEAARLGKENSKARNGIALLELETGELRKLSRIEALAKGRFGLELVKAPIPVYPEGGFEERGASVAAKGGKTESGKVAWLTRGL
jgi:cell division protein FtsL